LNCFLFVGTLGCFFLADGGGGNRDADFCSRLGYGGDNESDKSKGNRLRKKRLLLVYQYMVGRGGCLDGTCSADDGSLQWDSPALPILSLPIRGWHVMAWLELVHRSNPSLDCSYACLVDTIRPRLQEWLETF